MTVPCCIFCNLYFSLLQSPDENDNYTEFDGYIDLGKEMSVLHTLLNDTLEKAPQVGPLHLFLCPAILSFCLRDNSVHFNECFPLLVGISTICI